MKKTFTFLSLFFLAVLGLNAQSIYFSNTETIESFSDTSAFIIDGGKNYIVNSGTRDVAIIWERIANDRPDNWSTQVCTVPSAGEGTCYAESKTWNEEFIAAGDSFGLKIQYTTRENPGAASVTLKFYAPGDSANVNGIADFTAEMWSTNIAELDENEKVFRTFPNPVINKLNVVLNNYQDVRFIEIYNLVGTMVRSVAVETPNGEFDIDLMDLGEGMFFISLIDSNEQMILTRRFSKVR